MNDKVIEILYIYSNLVLYTQKMILNSDQFTYDDANTAYRKMIDQVSMEMSRKSLEKYHKVTLLAYIAWIDEQIMLSNLTFKKEWMKNLLQKEYFQTTDLGHGFFVHYHSLEDANKDIKFIYLYVLFLGFKGKYTIEEEGLENFIKDELTSNDYNANIEVDYFNKIYDIHTPTLKPMKQIALLQGGYLMALVIIAIVSIIAMYFSLEHDLDTLFTRLETIQ